MAEIDSAEPLAGSVITQRDAPLTAGLADYAAGHVARFERFGVAALDPSDPLIDSLIGRWSLPERLENGLELFDLDMLGELSRGWSSRVGYFDAQFGFDNPFVVPVDPEQPVPMDAGHVRRSRQRRPARAMRPVAPRATTQAVNPPSAGRPDGPAGSFADRIAERWTAEPTETPADFDGPLDATLVAPAEAPAADRIPDTRPETVDHRADRRAATRPTSPSTSTARTDLPGRTPMNRAGADEPRIAAALAAPPDAAQRTPGTPAATDARRVDGPARATTGPATTTAARGPQDISTASATEAPRPMSTLARQRWRAVDAHQLTPYPRAMGRAGAIDAGLLRFPDARARVGGDRPAILAGPRGLDLMPDRGGIAPASRGAERLVQRLFDALVPMPEPVGAWLMPLVDAEPSLGIAASSGDAGPIESALALRAPTGELVAPDTPRPELTPARTTQPSRPRADGRLPLPAPRTVVAPGAVSRPASAGERPSTRAGQTASAGRPVETTPVPRDPAPLAARGEQMIETLPQATRAALATTSIASRSVTAEAPRPTPLSGARAWLHDAFVAPPDALPAAQQAGRPGAIGAAARVLAERLAVSAGEPPLLADTTAEIRPLWLPENAAAVLVEPQAAAAGAGARPSAEQAPAARPSTVRSDAARSDAARSDAARSDAARSDAARSDAARSDAARSDAAPLEAAAATPDSAVQPDAARDVSGSAAPMARADAAAWAGQIVQRLGADRSAAAMDAVIGRIADRLAGGTLLAETLSRFEAAEAPEARARAWRSVVDAAGLDPETAALVHPVADRPADSPSAADARPQTSPTATATGGAPAPRMSPVTPATTPRPAATSASAQPPARTPTGDASSIRGRAALAVQRSGERSGVSARPAIGQRRPTPAAPGARPAWSTAAPGTFERRMGLSDVTRPPGPAEARRWVLDPDGQRWLVPLATAQSAPSQGMAPRAPDRARGSTVSDGAIGGGRRPLATSPTAELAERIVSSLLPDSQPSMTAVTARVLTRLAPEAAAAWVTSGFDPLVLPANERALVQATALTAAASSAASSSAASSSAASSSAASSSAASPVDRGAGATPPDPLARAARAQAQALSRPGALGAAMARLADRVVERPTMAARGSSPRPVVAPPAGATAGNRAADRTPAGGVAGAADRPASAAAGSRSAGRLPSAMDPMALVAAGASAAESRMPARLRQWAAIGDASAAGPRPGAYEETPPTVVVSPGGPVEGAADGETSTTTGGSSAASLPGSRTAAAALRAFDRARVGNGSQAPAVGRAPVSAADVGQLVAAAMTREPPGGRLFGDRGPLVVSAPGAAGRVYIQTGKRASGDQPLRSTGESAGPRAETNDDARHRLASQTEGDLSPEELEKIADEVIAQLRREMEFEGSRFGGDEWD